MTKMIVIDHAVGWHEKDHAGVPRPVFGFRGEEHDIPDDEIARLKRQTEGDGHTPGHGRPLVGTREDYEDWTGVQAAAVATAAELSDEQLRAMSPEQMLAAMNQDNSLAPRILDYERSKPGRSRKAIVDHAERLIAGPDAPVEPRDDLEGHRELPEPPSVLG